MSRRGVDPQIPFTDIHCHMIPGIDDGASSWQESLEMARIAVEDGIGTVIVTPHQLGMFSQNRGELIRAKAAEFQQRLQEENVPLKVLPGADVRIEPDMIDRLQSGDVLSLADRRKHVLLELPHEMYFPLEPVLDALQRSNMVGILSHPERNQGLLEQPHLTAKLVEYGCLMQVTAGSLTGRFGPQSQAMSDWMIQEGLVHFLATDAHGIQSRRPRMRRAFQRITELAGDEVAMELCCRNPAAVADGQDVSRARGPSKRRAASRWRRRRKSA